VLVLSRKKNETIVINDNVSIVVIEIRGDKVRLGIEAPKEIPVHRGEVQEAIQLRGHRADSAQIQAGLHIGCINCGTEPANHAGPDGIYCGKCAVAFLE
jgi:carbon storage regulator